MLKYYRVNTEEGVASRLGTFVHNRTEIILAPSTEAIFEDCLNRFGEHLISMEAEEVEEDSIMPNTVIYVVM